MATDATGTPTTNYAIPKVDPSVDAPSGLGVNAMMDAIDTLLKSTFASKPAGVQTNDVPVWNGTTWVRPSGTPSASVFLRGDGSWASAGGSPSLVTALPGSPTDGQEVILVDSTTTLTYAFRLRYNSGSSSSSKWEFMGGVPMFAEVTAAEATSSSSYVALTTAGPSLALPVAGDWYIATGFDLTAAVNASVQPKMSYDIGATGAVDADAVLGATQAVGAASVFRTRKKTGLTAVTLTAKYKSDGTNSKTFENRWMMATPIRLG